MTEEFRRCGCIAIGCWHPKDQCDEPPIYRGGRCLTCRTHQPEPPKPICPTCGQTVAHVSPLRIDPSS